MASRKKNVLIAIILIALCAGAGAALIVHRSTATPPVIEDDINAHFQDALTSGPETDTDETLETQDTRDTAIQQTRLTLKKDRTASKKRKTSRTKNERASKTSAAPIAGIECIAEGTCLIDRELFIAAAKNPNPYIGGVRATAVRVGERLEGFRLRNTDGYVSAIGLRDDDTLQAINGFPLTSTANVSRAMAGALRSTQFRLDILRGKKPMSLYYRLK